jgi:hypothetical protein
VLHLFFRSNHDTASLELAQLSHGLEPGHQHVNFREAVKGVGHMLLMRDWFLPWYAQDHEEDDGGHGLSNGTKQSALAMNITGIACIIGVHQSQNGSIALPHRYQKVDQKVADPSSHNSQDEHQRPDQLFHEDRAALLLALSPRTRGLAAGQKLGRCQKGCAATNGE